MRSTKNHNYKTILKFSICIIVASFFLSCKKEKSCEGCKENNKPPIAIAGPDQVITLPTDSVLLDGRTSSDPDGMISSYGWTKISGPASSTIFKPSDSTTMVKALVAGTYQFELKVTDNVGLSAKDTMRVTVDSVLTINHPPIANAGADQTITLPTNSVNLDGSRSTDPENNIANYEWAKISGPSSLNILNANAAQTQVTNLVQGVYQFELKVTDAGVLFSKDTMQVTVNPATSNNLPPVAKAGNDTIIQTNQTSCTPLPVTITLNGSNSYDSDGTIVSYFWTGWNGYSYMGTNGMTTPDSEITTVTGLVPSTYSFFLKVTDNNGAVGYDTIQISILLANRPLIPAQLIPIATIPEMRGGFAFAAATNKLVFAGGTGGQQGQCNSSRVDIYDINSNSWTTSQVSEARYGMGTAVLGNKIFFAGGYKGMNYPQCYIGNGWFPETRSSVIDIYDASSNTWATAQLSSRRVPCGAAAGNKVLFAGGDFSSVVAIPSNVTDIYEATNYSQASSSLSEAKGLQQIATSGNKIYLAGGANQVSDCDNHVIVIYKRIDIYDALSNTWSVDHLSEERAGMGAIGVNNKIYWAGGYIMNSNAYCGIGATNSVEIRDLATNTTSFDCLSEAKEQVTALLKDNKIIFWGGQNGRFDIYDLTTGSWSIGVLPQNLLSASVISYNNTIFIAGATVNGVLSNQVWKLEF
jgi:hypothetical protein